MKLDIGAGKNKKAGFIGVDQYPLEGVDWLCNVGASDIWSICRAPNGSPRPEDAKDAVFAMQFAPVQDGAAAGEPPFCLADNSVEEVNCSHFLEHLTNLGGKWERVKFFNELYRVMKVGATATIIMPHWNSARYYGDPTHKEPFSEFGWMYLDRAWRKSQAPATDIEFNPDGYDCDFSGTWGGSLHPQVSTRHSEFQQFAMTFYKEAWQDMHCTLVKK
jgi:hypothetical protein